VLVISLDARNLSPRTESVLIVPFSSSGIEGPTTLRLEAGETGLPVPSWLKGHFVATLKKAELKVRVRALSTSRMREVVTLVRRAIDPDAPAWESSASRSRAT
jgi:mRNA-degrading endonuclease toxin of MazEF toxin-antitoxin module